jgi:hypothetical protein
VCPKYARRAKAGHVPVWSKMGDFFEVMYQIRLDNAHKNSFRAFCEVFKHILKPQTNFRAHSGKPGKPGMPRACPEHARFARGVPAALEGPERPQTCWNWFNLHRKTYYNGF